MENRTYDYIWSQAIEANIKELYEKIPNKDKIRFKVVFPDLLLLKQSIYESYYRRKERLKELYHYDEDSDTQLIDVHKIAACFAAVLMENKVFSYSIEDGLTDEIFLLNANLAYNASIDIIMMNLLSYYKSNNNDTIVTELLQRKSLYFPETTIGHDEYNLGRQKTIVLNDLYGNDFDILTYSDMMFWIEFYNRQILEKTFNPKPMGMIYDE